MGCGHLDSPEKCLPIEFASKTWSACPGRWAIPTIDIASIDERIVQDAIKNLAVSCYFYATSTDQKRWREVLAVNPDINPSLTVRYGFRNRGHSGYLLKSRNRFFKSRDSRSAGNFYARWFRDSDYVTIPLQTTRHVVRDWHLIFGYSWRKSYSDTWPLLPRKMEGAERWTGSLLCGKINLTSKRIRNGPASNFRIWRYPSSFCSSPVHASLIFFNSTPWIFIADILQNFPLAKHAAKHWIR